MFEPDASRVLFEPALSGEYLAKRFGEALWESPLGAYLNTLPEVEADRIESGLVARLLIEIGID
ncbi:hypothetical protein ACQEV9_15485 [Streptomyces chartreusis]|uniref:hypothetical protein n=1 Tax=Streptomyces chartreusis TaxID=1969 RepID=UPI003D90EB75